MNPTANPSCSSERSPRRLLGPPNQPVSRVVLPRRRAEQARLGHLAEAVVAHYIDDIAGGRRRGSCRQSMAAIGRGGGAA
jgi:hypothetical protein